jgi:hypothetical protein
MARVSRVGLIAVGTIGGLIAAGRARRAVTQPHKAVPEWLGVTVLAPPERIAPGGELPEPLRAMGDAIEVRMEPAPGDRGTELYARRTDGTRPGATASRLTGGDDLAELRTALREAKSLVECGEVVQPVSPPKTHPGPAGRVLAALDRRAQGAGRL